MKILYKKDSKGKIRKLNIYTNKAILYQKSGLIDGKMVTHSKVCTAKNVGKSNETTPEEQAKLQATALVVKKLSEGYFEDILEAQNSNYISPMLAKDYFKEYKKLKGKYLALQPKLDGIRCVITVKANGGEVTAISRKNKPIKNIDHILKEIKKKVGFVFTDWIFDGELYLHGKTFQEVTKLVNNKPGKEKVRYHIYDMIETESISFYSRFKQIEEAIGYNCKYLETVPTIIEPKDSLEDYYGVYIQQGYEGMMVRVLDSNYKINGRSSDLLKYKEFLDIALPIIDIVPAEANPKHGIVVVKYKGLEVSTGAKVSHKDREDLLTNKDDYIGKTAEIRYFEETDAGNLRFPVFHGIRIDK